MENVYRLRHKETGLFFCQSKGKSGKSNLSKNSRPTFVKPSFPNAIYIDGKTVQTTRNDWEIIVYEVKEVEIKEL